MEDVLVPILVPLITFSMPVLLCWVYYRNEMHTTSQRTEIVKAVIEKNPDLDVEALLQKMNPKQKLLKEKLLSRLLWGCITGLIGLGLLIGSVFACYAGGWEGDEINFMWITGAISLERCLPRRWRPKPVTWSRSELRAVHSTCLDRTGIVATVPVGPLRR